MFANLLLGFHRAGPRRDHNFRPADRTPLPRSTIEPSGRQFRAASLNGCEIGTISSTPGAARSASSSRGAVAVADDSNHGSLLPAAQVRLKTTLLNAFHDVVNLFFRCIGHVDDHFPPRLLF